MSSSTESAAVTAAENEVDTNAQASREAARLGRAYHARGNVNLIVDSCADFAPEVARALGVEVIPFPYVMSDGEHADDLWETMSAHDFYERMRAGEHVTTSAVTPGHYLEVFERAAAEGTPTVYLAFTRGLSSSVDAARQAADMVREAHPDFQIYVVDNVCPSAAAELLAIEAVRQVANGLTAAAGGLGRGGALLRPRLLHAGVLRRARARRAHPAGGGHGGRQARHQARALL